MNLNKYVLAGRLTRDPETRTTSNGTTVVEIGVATNRWKQGGEEEVTYLNATFFGEKAESLARHFCKGQAIYLEGFLTVDSWEDKQTGQKRSAMKIVGFSWQFVGPKPGAGAKDDVRQREAIERPDDDEEIPF